MVLECGACSGVLRVVPQVDPAGLAKALCYKNIGGSREVIFVNYTKAVASDSRDSLTKVQPPTRSDMTACAPASNGWRSADPVLNLAVCAA